MLLVGKPEQYAAFKVVSWIVLGTVHGFRGGSTNDNTFSLVINIPALLNFISVLLCRIARMSLFTDGQ